jgi:ABC-2 type transport system ATP-binding protein
LVLTYRIMNVLVEISNLSKIYNTSIGVKTVFENVNAVIYKGEAVGIIGVNGAGKSTLLKVIAGIVKPSSGSVKCFTSLSSLIDLGQNIIPELTGFQNISINIEINRNIDVDHARLIQDIIAFSELGDNIHLPVKSYSSGMLFRLGFSILTHLSNDILLIDEIISVGDANFKQKSLLKIKELLSNGKTLLIATHDLNLLRMLCSRSILLDKGSVKIAFTPEIISEYNNVSQGRICNSSLSTPTQDIKIELIHISSLNVDSNDSCIFDDKSLEIKVWFKLYNRTRIGITLNIFSSDSIPIIDTGRIYMGNRISDNELEPGLYDGTVVFPAILLSPNCLNVGVDFHNQEGIVLLSVANALKIEVKAREESVKFLQYYNRDYALRPLLHCKIERRNEVKKPFFRYKDWVSTLCTNGYLFMPPIPEEKVKRLRDFFFKNINEYQVESVNKSIISINSSSIEAKRGANDFINEELHDYFNYCFIDYKIIISSFVAKLRDHESCIGFHQEPTFIDPEHFDDFTIWIPLENIGKDDGALVLVKNSHIWANDLNMFTYSPPYYKELKDAEFLEIDAEVGRPVIFFNRLIHGSRPNINKDIRLAVSIKVTYKDAPIFSYYCNRDGLVEQFEQPDDYYFSKEWDQTKRPSNRISKEYKYFR